MGTEPQRPPLIERLQAQRDKHRRRARPIRLLYVAAGFTITLAGVVMLVTPGPAFVVIPVGLAILSLEFAWAEQLLEAAIEKGEQAKVKASEATRTQRILSVTAVLLMCAAFATWAWFEDVPFLPV